MSRIVVGSIYNVEELDGSPFESGNREGRTVTRKFRIGSHTWLAGILAEMRPATGGSLPGVMPGEANLYYDSHSLSPLAGEESIIAASALTGEPFNKYNDYLLTVTYAPLPYDPSTLISVETTNSGEFVTMPGRSFEWEDGTKIHSEDIAVGQLVRFRDHQVTLHRVSEAQLALLQSPIRQCVGHINLQTFLGSPPGCMMFLGDRETYRYNADGTTEFSLTYTFKEKLIDLGPLAVGQRFVGWPYFWDPDTNRWRIVKVSNDADGNPPQHENVFPFTNPFGDGSADFPALFNI